jgi:succinate dehydrogenase/fumarate reductase flavoprotein subunit
MSAPSISKTPGLVSLTDVAQWDEEADVLVIGFGMAGSCAALGARHEGADVLVLERASGVSGTTTAATGHFYLGGGTRPQLANDIDDDAEQMYQYLMANTPNPEPAKIRLYADNSVAHFNWLSDMGVPFNDGFYKKKHFEQPTDECLIWSGNEKAWPISEKAKPAPRGHKVEKEGSEGGGLVMKKLTERAEADGVRFVFDANVKNLVLDGDTVVGVCFSVFGQDKFARARKGVILSAGGFSMNNEMLEECCPRLTHKNIMKQGNPFDDGMGIKLGLSAGGEALHMEGCLVTAPFYPPESLLKAILVNKHGKRFVAEDSYHARSASACLDQDDGEVYLICDNEIFERPELGLQQLIDGYETIEEMESSLGLPEGALQNTMAAYNEHAANAEDPEFHKYKDWLQPLNNPPYAAFQCSLNEALYVGFTLGGLKVSEDGEVLSEKNGASIKGLYAKST